MKINISNSRRYKKGLRIKSIDSSYLVLFAVLFSIFACKRDGVATTDVDATKIPTVTTRNLDIKDYKDSVIQYRFKAPLMERYALVDSPYMEFKEGVHIETYNDSTRMKETELEAEYAYYDEKAKIWEARGNVVASNHEGRTLYTEQIFWDEKKKTVYSHVKTKVVDGEEITIGSGFESDEALENIEFKQTKGRIYLDTTQNREPLIDSLSVDSLSTDSLSINSISSTDTPALTDQKVNSNDSKSDKNKEAMTAVNID
ncbi:MAG: LPS export ABC transporter periplasmic protein LptC [Rikenellaceae bacterium]